MPQSYLILKQKHRTVRENHPDNLSLRIHRALSWLKKAEQFEDDKDMQFITLWIAFNAAYAHDVQFSEKDRFQQFLNKICKLDRQQKIYAVVWQQFPNAIRVLLNNQFVYQPFWDFYNGRSSHKWQNSFEAAKRRANAALSAQNTDVLLSIVFSRLYTLRNQLVHGGATHNSSINREQLRDATALMSNLVPLVIEVMMDNPNTLWGEPHYLVVKE